jgi:PleD family two-component response regulator
MQSVPDRTPLERKKELGRILNREVFLYFLDHEVKRALRYQNFLSVLLLRLVPFSRENDGKGFEACRQTLENVLKEEMRETDILGSLAENKLAALLPYADVNASDQAKVRFENTLKYYDFKNWGYDVMVQQFSFPKNGTNTVDVIRKAMDVEPIRNI